MPGFARMLTELRRKRGFTQKTLAEKIGKSTTYISALETEGGVEKCPSLETLRDLVHALGADESCVGGLDLRLALPLVSSALDLNYDLLPPDIADEEAYNVAFKAAEVVWCVSGVLMEALSMDYAQVVANKIKADDTTFVFVVPYSLPTWQCRSLVENLRRLQVEAEALEKRVAIFRASDCAFPISFQICDPLSSNPQGFYFFSSDALDQRPIVRRMPRGVCAQNIGVYDNLCSMFHHQLQGSEIGKFADSVGDEENGHIQIVHPRMQPRQDAQATAPEFAFRPRAYPRVRVGPWIPAAQSDKVSAGV